LKEQNVVGAIAVLLFLSIGIVLIVWPDHVRKYDAKMTVIVKDPSTYKLLARSVGVMFIIASGLILVILSTSH